MDSKTIETIGDSNLNDVLVTYEALLAVIVFMLIFRYEEYYIFYRPLLQVLAR